jgi:hypothetical protein
MQGYSIFSSVQIMMILLGLVAAHFLCDYLFQTESIALGKNRLLAKARFGVHWLYWMTTHAVTHSVGVYIVTGSLVASVFEFIAHFIIDVAKCEGYIGLHLDQALHMACKVIILVWLVSANQPI